MGKVLQPHHWPDADRAAFLALFTEGGLLDDQGPLAHWRAPSREAMKRQYGLWLGWVSRTEPEALRLQPIERATPKRLRVWLAAMGNLAPATLLGYVGTVVRLCRSIDPDRGWTAHQAILSGLHRAAKNRGSPRKTGRILSSDVLFEAGARLVRENDGPIKHPDQAVRLRDGAVICLLALMPMRRRALSELALGTSLRVEGDRMMICLDGSMTKNGQPWEAVVPDMLREMLAIYLQVARPALSARGSGNHDSLWLGRNGVPVSVNQFTRAIQIRTKSLIGVRVTPHLFRDAAATTLARASSSSARMIKPILGHSTTRIAEGHYIQADTIAAGRGLASALNDLRKEGVLGGWRAVSDMVERKRSEGSRGRSGEIARKSFRVRANADTAQHSPAPSERDRMAKALSEAARKAEAESDGKTREGSDKRLERAKRRAEGVKRSRSRPRNRDHDKGFERE